MCKLGLSDSKVSFSSRKLALLADKVIPSIGKAALPVAEVILFADKLGLSQGKGCLFSSKPGLPGSKPNGTLMWRTGEKVFTVLQWEIQAQAHLIPPKSSWSLA